MADIVSKEKRSLMMAGIRGKNTQPELIIRKKLHALGFRFRLHGKKLPGKPDMVFPKYKAVILVNGCFWHNHDCHLFKWPSSRPDFWKAKLEKNRQNDNKALQALLSSGWRVLMIWECAIKGRSKKPIDDINRLSAKWLKGKSQFYEIRGHIEIPRASGVKSA